MTQIELIDKISVAYQKAAELKEGKGNYDILRGTAHTVSGYMEDAFALYMATRIGKKEYQYLVDKLISCQVGSGAKAVTFKPDLSILDKSVLTQYYDLKTNLGWNRKLENYLKKKNELIGQIKGKKGWIYFPGIDNQNIQFSEKLIYKMVVYDGWNISRNQLEDNISLASELENVELFILKKWDENAKMLMVDQNAFDNLY